MYSILVWISCVQWTCLTLSNSANSSSRGELTGSFRNLANSSIVMRPPLQELAMDAKPSSSFLTLSHFRLSEQGTMRKDYFVWTLTINTTFQAIFVNLKFPAWWHNRLYIKMVNVTAHRSVAKVSWSPPGGQSTCQVICRRSSLYRVYGTHPQLTEAKTSLLEFTADFGELDQAGLHGQSQFTSRDHEAAVFISVVCYWNSQSAVNTHFHIKCKWSLERRAQQTSEVWRTGETQTTSFYFLLKLSTLF